MHYQNELESSIMLSKPPASHPEIPPNRRGMSLTLLTRTRNPAQTARRLFLSPERTTHPFLSGSAAEEIAEELGEMLVDPSYFFTEKRWREHRRGLGLPEEPLPYPPDKGEPKELGDSMPKGTVGAVALDANGCIATVTSTGGLTNKLVGRIGDTPVMGAGFWAGEWKVRGPLRRAWRRLHKKGVLQAVGVSGTGDGDVSGPYVLYATVSDCLSQYFIRTNAAARIASRMQYLGETLRKASATVVQQLKENEGMGGVIALDSDGNCMRSSALHSLLPSDHPYRCAPYKQRWNVQGCDRFCGNTKSSDFCR